MNKKTFIAVFVLLGGLNCILTVTNKDTFPPWLRILFSCLQVLIALAMITVVIIQLKTNKGAKKEKNLQTPPDTAA